MLSIKKDRENYLPEALRYQTAKINGDYAMIFNNKMVFNDFFKSRLPLTQNIFYIDKKGVVWSLEKTIKRSNIDELVNVLRRKPMVAKPPKGGGGNGVFLIKNLIDEKWEVDSQIITTNDLVKILKSLKDYLFTELVKQSAYTSVLNPKSTNTFRVMMFRDPLTKEIVTHRVLIRIGNKKTGIPDNFNDGAGSFVGKVNLNLEKLEAVTMIDDEFSSVLIDRHPDHGVCFKGRKFPGIKKAVLELESVLDDYPFINYVGWDLVLTKDGYKIIEGNNHPSFMLAQIYEPLMSDSRSTEFYRYWMDLK